MGQGEEVKVRGDPETHILERGEIFFFYRAKVNKEEAHSPDEVQRLYMVLRPESCDRPVEEKQSPDSGKEGAKAAGSPSPSPSSSSSDTGDGKRQTEGRQGVQEVKIEKEPIFRLLVMGKKSLPDPRRKSTPFWGFVELVTTNIDDLKAALVVGEEYDTSTRGHRRKYPARALGEGIYRVLNHESGRRGRKAHTHLVYRLEFPPADKQNEPQESLNIEREASFLIQIKNPEQHRRDNNNAAASSSSSGFRGIQDKRKAVFPAHLQGEFGSNRYSPADPPDFLNYEGCEFLLISASDDVEEELGLELKAEEVEEGAGGEVDPSCSDLVKTFGEGVPCTPLFEGTWG